MTAPLFAATLPVWTEAEIEAREAFQIIAAGTVRRALIKINPAFRVQRFEGPCLTPAAHMNAAYSYRDVFVTNHIYAGDPLSLRAETTASTYAAIRALGPKLPFCGWQVGKSFRRELNDGASASRLRFNEFWQQEFQAVYRADTKADYRAAVIDAIVPQIETFTRCNARVIESDRLPSYSVSTLDIEVRLPNGQWREIASCSIRTDYADGILVSETAIGLCRIVAINSAKEATT